MAADAKTWRKIRSSVSRMKRVLETEKPDPGMREWCYGQWENWIEGLYQEKRIDVFERGRLLIELGDYKKYGNV